MPQMPISFALRQAAAPQRQALLPVGMRGVFLVMALLAGVSAGFGAALDRENPVTGAILGAGGAVLATSIVIALLDWRRGLFLLLLLALAEDSVRKALPGLPGWVPVMKDLVAAAAYISYFFGPRGGRLPLAPDFKVKVVAPVVLWLGLVILQMFNPNVPHVLVAISGLRTWSVYVPLTLLVYASIRDGEVTAVWLRRIVYLAVPFLGLCLLQNDYRELLPGFLTDRAFFGERWLESGEVLGYNESFFATPTLYALICLLQFCLVVGLLKVGQQRRHALWLWVCGYCAVCGAYLSGIRTGLSLIVCGVIAMFPLAFARFYQEPRGPLIQPEVRMRGGLLAGGVIGLIFGAILVGTMGPSRTTAFWTALSPAVVQERVDFAVSAPLAVESGLFGNGTGTAGASGRVMSLIGRPSGSAEWVEWGGALIRYCFGDVGLVAGGLLMAWFFIGLMLLAFENRSMRYAPLRIALWVYLCGQFAWYLLKAFPILENGTMCLVFWASVGALLGFARLDREAAQRMAP